MTTPTETFIVAQSPQTYLNAAAQNDAELVAAVAANTVYAFRLGIRYQNANSGINFQITFTVPVGGSVFVQVAQKCFPQSTGTGTGTGSPVAAAVANAILGANNDIDRIEMIGVVRISSTAGNLQMQARRTGGLTDAVRLAGSYLILSV